MSRLERLIGRLRPFYGVLKPPPHEPFQLFVWEVMSTHSMPRKRDAAIDAFRKLRALTPDSVWRLPKKALEDTVKLAGPYVEQRLESLRIGVEIFRANRDLASNVRGPLPQARRALRDLPQMGEGGAYRMLLFAAEHPVLPVDARLSRVARRLGFGEANKNFAKEARSIREAVAPELPATIDAYRRAYLYLAHHGANTCTERDPHCSVCPLLEDCPEGQRRMKFEV